MAVPRTDRVMPQEMPMSTASPTPGSGPGKPPRSVRAPAAPDPAAKGRAEEPEPGHDPPRLERDEDSPLGRGEDISLQPRNESVEAADTGPDPAAEQHEGPHEGPCVDRDPMEPQRDDFFPR
jgi:hypothetical protein